MSAEENKTIFRRYTEEVGTQGKLELVDEIFDRYIAHQPDGSALERGPEDVKRFHREWRSAFPDVRISIEDQVAEGDKVVSRYTIRGTHQRAFRGMAPTGKEIELKGVTIFRFSPEGKVVETWDSYDQLSLMRQSIEQELRVARSIQQASLPEEVPQLEGWQISPYYQPASGQGIFFYSDDLVEAHDPKGEMFGFPRLRALVAEQGEEGSLGDFCLEALYSFVGEGWEQEHDITLLTLRRSPSRS